jgi:hypothetical protein
MIRKSENSTTSSTARYFPIIYAVKRRTPRTGRGRNEICLLIGWTGTRDGRPKGKLPRAFRQRRVGGTSQFASTKNPLIFHSNFLIHQKFDKGLRGRMGKGGLIRVQRAHLKHPPPEKYCAPPAQLGAHPPIGSRVHIDR